MNENETLFKNAPVHKVVFQMAIPTVISSLVLIIYNMADTFFVGQTHDAYQVAAVSLTNPVFVMYMAIANLLGIQPLLGYCYGANNKKRFISIMKFSGMLTLISGTVLSAIYIIFSRPVVTLFINDTQTISDYLAIVISLLLLRRSLRKFKGDPS